MQGFNRYIPPDYDPKKNSTLNSHQGKKHALGARAKDIDKGVLVVRFELPFNIWCESCGNHLGAGVRYNAQKKKVGNYYSTPIYAFRCKCHLCQNWFELRTDPQNAAYIVHEGAKKKDEDWSPEENGGFATHDTEAPSAADAPIDPFAATEKTIDQQTWAKTKTSRLTELADSSDRISADPYAVSASLRRKFREEKKVMLEKQGRDDGLRERYGLHEDVDLGDEDVEGGRARWEAGRERRGLPVDDENSGEGSTAGTLGTPRDVMGVRGSKGKGRAMEGSAPSPSLAQVLRRTTKRKYDPFAEAADSFFSSPRSEGRPVAVRRKTKDPDIGTPEKGKVEVVKPVLGVLGIAGGLLAGYGSD